MAVGQIYQRQATGEWLRAGGVLLGGDVIAYPPNPDLSQFTDTFEDAF